MASPSSSTIGIFSQVMFDVVIRKRQVSNLLVQPRFEEANSPNVESKSKNWVLWGHIQFSQCATLLLNGRLLARTLCLLSYVLLYEQSLLWNKLVLFSNVPCDLRYHLKQLSATNNLAQFLHILPCRQSKKIWPRFLFWDSPPTRRKGRRRRRGRKWTNLEEVPILENHQSPRLLPQPLSLSLSNQTSKLIFLWKCSIQEQSI